MSKDESEEITALDELTKLVTTKEWRQYVKILQEHKQYLQKEVNQSVKGQDLISAYGNLMKLEDVDKQLLLVKNKLAELQKGV